MSKVTQGLRGALNHSLDALEMVNYSEGWEAAVEAMHELSNLKHNEGDTAAADALVWAAKELRGENS
jgi:hypothetical protein